MSEREHVAPRHGNAYELFILVLTVVSLTIMAIQLLGTLGILPIKQETIDLLNLYENLTCVVFLIDFAMNMIQTKPRRDYFIGKRGWLDLIGSIPSLGITQYGGLLRLARLSRLARVTRLLGGQRKKELAEDVIRNRGSYAAFITLMAAFVVLVTASVLVLQFEYGAPGSNIETGGDALWWAIVTITTVGYGDTYPVTALGRITAVAVMFAGVGIIGALASILASVLVPSPEENAEAAGAEAAAAGPGPGAPGIPSSVSTEGGADIRSELAAIRAELVANREELAASRAELAASRAEISSLRETLTPTPESAV
jgi:voltage-gated potassium channel